METHQHRKIACLEEIGYLNGWIGKDQLLTDIEPLKKKPVRPVSDGCDERKIYRQIKANTLKKTAPEENLGQFLKKCLTMT